MIPFPILNPHRMLENWIRIMNNNPSVEDFKDFEEQFQRNFVKKELPIAVPVMNQDRDDPDTSQTNWVNGDQELFGSYICRPGVEDCNDFAPASHSWRGVS